MNPAIRLLIVVFAVVAFFGRYITMGTSYKKRRAAAKARRAKKMKAKRRKK
jgi:hypothetical protein